MLFLVIFLLMLFAARRSLRVLSACVSLGLLVFAGLYLPSEIDGHAQALFVICIATWLWIWPLSLWSIWKNAGLEKVSDLRLRRG